MKFLILMSNDDTAWSALSHEEQARVIAGHGDAERELREGGHLRGSWRLRPAAEARSVLRDARGGFETRAAAEVCPQLGGAYLIEVAARADAEPWARRLRFIAGANEVREVWE